MAARSNPPTQIARFVIAGVAVAMLGPAPAVGGIFAPICANGEITFIMIEFGREDGPDAPSAACHGACPLQPRKAVPPGGVKPKP
ncbi:MAG: hypothetical protein AAFW81_05370 [Pseudomonadota bacterium]